MLDVRCSLNKKFLQNNNQLSDVHSSQLKIREDNRIEFELGIGCGVFVYMGDSMDIVTRNKDVKNEDWKNWRSFFVHGKGFYKFKFENSISHTRVMAHV